MVFNLYKTICSDNVINKVLTDKVTINVNLKSNTDIINPTILLENISGVNILDYNYCEIVELGRFYFINSIDYVTFNISKLNCSCDVLETFKSEILNSVSRYSRSIKVGDFMDADFDRSIFKTIELSYSDVDVEGQSSMIMTTIAE